jgi:hypothetical protein
MQPQVSVESVVSSVMYDLMVALRAPVSRCRGCIRGQAPRSGEGQSACDHARDNELHRVDLAQPA